MMNQTQQLDPLLEEKPLDGGFEASNGHDSPESEDNAPDVQPTTEKHHEIFLDYWKKAKDAGFLTDSEYNNELFFQAGNLPIELDPEDGQPALTTQQRAALYERVENDRKSEDVKKGEKSQNVKILAKISLTQAFADLVIFRESVVGALHSVSTDSGLRDSLKADNPARTHIAVVEAQKRIHRAAVVHGTFEQYTAVTQQLMDAYYREFPDDAPSFINTLNGELYRKLEKQVGPAAESGKMAEYGEEARIGFKDISFTELVNLADEAEREAREAVVAQPHQIADSSAEAPAVAADVGQGDTKPKAVVELAESLDQATGNTTSTPVEDNQSVTSETQQPPPDNPPSPPPPSEQTI